MEETGGSVYCLTAAGGGEARQESRRQVGVVARGWGRAGRGVNPGIDGGRPGNVPQGTRRAIEQKVSPGGDVALFVPPLKIVLFLKNDKKLTRWHEVSSCTTVGRV